MVLKSRLRCLSWVLLVFEEFQPHLQNIRHLKFFVTQFQVYIHKHTHALRQKSDSYILHPHSPVVQLFTFCHICLVILFLKQPVESKQGMSFPFTLKNFSVYFLKTRILSSQSWLCNTDKHQCLIQSLYLSFTK